jgi:hypothetical protein
VDVDPFDLARSKLKSGPKLRIDVVLADLDDEQADRLREVLHDRTYSRRSIMDGLKAWGHVVSDTAVDNWRQRHVPHAE